MDKCSLRVKRIAATFSRKIVNGESHESALAFLYSGISTENSRAVAEIIFATSVLPINLHRGIAQNSNNSQELTDYLKANSAYLDRAKASLIKNVPGFGSIEEAANTIENAAQLSKAQVEVEEIKNVVYAFPFPSNSVCKGPKPGCSTVPANTSSKFIIGIP